MSDYLRIDDIDGVQTAVELWTSPEDTAPEGFFHADIAALFKPRGDAAIGWTWNGSAFAAPAAPVPVVPDVTRAQAKIVLFRAGKLDAVKAAVAAAGGEASLWFDEAAVWQRDNEHVEAVRLALGMSAAEADDLFRQAVQIQV